MKNKKFLITGGTGSFGNVVAKRLLSDGASEVRIFSRDEKKQDDMRKLFKNPRVKFYLGDVREYDSLIEPCNGVNYIFHAAALKQVPSCEFYPIEAVKTNILGTENVLNAAINSNVEKIVCLSTDKAVYPINAMGVSKSMMEKIAIAKSRNSANTKICITRYGNVMGSRGSVIPLFGHQIELNQPLTITNPAMTRFMMTLDDAVDLVFYAFSNGNSGDLFVQKSPSATIGTLVDALEICFNKKLSTKIIGTRHGEKLYETLLSKEERAICDDMGEYFRISADVRSLDYDLFFNKGSVLDDHNLEYNSHNTSLLNSEELSKLIEAANIL